MFPPRKIHIDLYVCGKCFCDAGIRDFIKRNATVNKCSFCGVISKAPIAASLDEVAEHMNSCLHQEYDDAANHLFYESAEGGYQGDTWVTWELLEDVIGLELPNDVDYQLFIEIVNRLDEIVWCEAEPFCLNDQQQAKFTWEKFTDIVKHERRFFFTEYGEDSDWEEILSPADMLKRLFEYSETLGLFTPLKAGTPLFRARYEEPGQRLETAQDLGPPPAECAKLSNRMSPAGIVMLYTSDDQETALRETAKQPGTFVVGTFETQSPGLVLDLTKVPPIPSLFQEIPDSLEYHPRKLITFLSHIAEAISQPIAGDDRVNVDYVPTQIVTEYVRSRTLSEGTPIVGIRYSSAAHKGHVSYVFFATQENILPAPIENETSYYSNTENRWIKLVGCNRHTVTSSQLKGW